jgi:GNAT superfamily N-acetyltransferase
MDFTIRAALPGDAAGACEVLRRSIQEICVADHRHDPAILEAWLRNKTVATVRGWIEAPLGFTVVAEAGGRLVGVARTGGNNMVVLCYAVPEVLHQGVGKAMLGALETEARTRGVSALELKSTQTAHAFYLRQGYRDTGANESMFGLTGIEMRKELQE